MPENNQDQQDYQDYLDYQKYQASPVDMHSTGDKINAGFQGYANGLTFGQLPRLQAAAQTYAMPVLFPDPNIAVDKQLAAKGIKITQPSEPNYDQALKSYQQYHSDISNQMPDQYYGGEAVGAITNPALIKGMQVGGRGLISIGKKTYEVINSPPGKVIGGLLGGKYLLNKINKGGD